MPEAKGLPREHPTGRPARARDSHAGVSGLPATLSGRTLAT